jgi:hypothetical protein
MKSGTSAKLLGPGYRAALIAGAPLNSIMFFAEGAIGLRIGSAALDAIASVNLWASIEIIGQAGREMQEGL